MAMVGVDSGSLYWRTDSLSRLAWTGLGGRLAPFYMHQTVGWTLAMALPWWQHHKRCLGIVIINYYEWFEGGLQSYRAHFEYLHKLC